MTTFDLNRYFSDQHERSVVSEQQRQLWIGIVMDLMIAYYDAQNSVHHEWGAEHPDELIKTMCERVATAIGDGATADAVYESLHRRLKGRL